jgi:hypothetical protein
MATVAHRGSHDKIPACDWLDTLHRGSKWQQVTTYIVTSEPRTVAQNRSRILRTFYELRMMNFE